jgi:hypothetical protein
MKKEILTALFPFAMVACSAGTPGSGSVVTETREIRAFSKLSIGDETHVQMVIGDEASISVETDEELQANILLEYEDDRLTISENVEVDPSLLIVRIVSPRLAKLEATGEATAEIRGIDEDRLDLNIAGDVDLELKGKVGDFEIDAAGAGTVRADSLLAKRVKITAAGDVEMFVHASDAIDAELAGTSYLHYSGNPDDVDVDTDGSSSANHN